MSKEKYLWKKPQRYSLEHKEYAWILSYVYRVQCKYLICSFPVLLLIQSVALMYHPLSNKIYFVENSGWCVHQNFRDEHSCVYLLFNIYGQGTSSPGAFHKAGKVGVFKRRADVYKCIVHSWHFYLLIRNQGRYALHVTCTQNVRLK